MAFRFLGRAPSERLGRLPGGSRRERPSFIHGGSPRSFEWSTLDAEETRVTLSFSRDGIGKMTRAVRRRWARSAASYYRDICETALLGMSSRKNRTFCLLIISDAIEYTSEQQFAPMIRYRKALRRKLGVVFRWISLERALLKPASFFSGFDAIGLKLSFRSNQDIVKSVVKDLNNSIDRSKTKIIYFDGDDDQSIQWPFVLEWSDLYVKKHAFYDKTKYLSRFQSIAGEQKSNNLTDYVVGLAGSCPAEIVELQHSRMKAEPLHKLYIGWNIALDDKIAELVGRAKSTSTKRDIDILCRAFVPPDVWITPLRNTALAAVNRLSDRFAVLAPRERVSQDEYYRELSRSRICVSPIGYGELCWRDFEAILSGCLLIKPDIGYLATNPNIFIPYSTYIPVNWDYTNLEQVSEYYLVNENERLAIVANAYETLLSALTEDWFLQTFSTLLSRLNQQRQPSWDVRSAAVRKDQPLAAIGNSHHLSLSAERLDV